MYGNVVIGRNYQSNTFFITSTFSGAPTYFVLVYG